MVYRILLSVLLIFSFAFVSSPDVVIARTPHVKTSDIPKPELTLQQRRIRDASVKIITPDGGHGTGTLFKYHKHTLVITAAHVAVPHDQLLVLSKHGGVTAKPIYLDERNDIAVLFIDKERVFQSLKKLRIPLRLPNDIPAVGEEVFFSSYPSWHSKMTFTGSIAGYEKSFRGFDVIVHGWAWPGSSGSILFDKRGRAVSVLSAIDVNRLDPRFSAQGLPSIIWVKPLSLIDRKLLKRAISEETEEDSILGALNG